MEFTDVEKLLWTKVPIVPEIRQLRGRLSHSVGIRLHHTLQNERCSID